MVMRPVELVGVKTISAAEVITTLAAPQLFVMATPPTVPEVKASAPLSLFTVNNPAVSHIIPLLL